MLYPISRSGLSLSLPIRMNRHLNLEASKWVFVFSDFVCNVSCTQILTLHHVHSQFRTTRRYGPEIFICIEPEST